MVGRNDNHPDLRCIQLSLIASSEADKYQKRCEINMTWAVDGRGGESRFLSYRDWYFDDQLQCVVCTWRELKTLKSYVTTFCNDADNFATDVLDSLGDFFAMGEGLMRPGFGGQEDLPAKAKKVFPRSQGKSDGWLTNQITRSIRNNISYANPNHFSARSLRIGPTTEMAIS